ncbi:MAG: hypothetical protein A2070_12295 [Bdellovibrionales bacterium GWC1_52_8]|nr:MAG: hypothetical protein A2070_12295 [Bdellovibrionales bacterium GWC1_52_8]
MTARRLLIIRADFLAEITTGNPGSSLRQICVLFVGERSTFLKRQIADAAPGIEPLLTKGSGRAGVDTASTVATKTAK